MNELDLYRFVQGKELDWCGNELIIWIEPTELKEFTDLISDDYFCEGSIEVTLLSRGVVALDLNDICDCFDIDVQRIHPKDGAE
jgi:hypothetical protein